LKLIILSVLGGGAGLVLAEWLRRRHDWLTGPNYMQHLKDWDANSPQITPANIPALLPLKVTRRKLKKHAEPLRWAGRKGT